MLRRESHGPTKYLEPTAKMMGRKFDASLGYIGGVDSRLMDMKTPTLHWIGSIALAALLLFVESPQAQEERPAPGLGWQSLGGLTYGAGGLLVGGAAGAGILSGYCYTFGEDCGFAGIGGAFLGGILGFAGAFPYGVYQFGKDENHQASLAWTYGGTVAGAAIGFGATALATQLQDEDDWFASACFGLLGAPIGALISYNLTRTPNPALPQVSLAPLIHGGAAGNLTWRF
jgi:hypothetical protein